MREPCGNEPVDVERVLAGYRRWLARQPLAERTRDAYVAQVRGFLAWLADSEHGAAGLTEPQVRDWAVRDYKRWVKAAPRRWAPASVNQALAALDNVYRHLGAGRPQVGREELPRLAPHALDTGQQRVFLRTVDACPSARDRALAVVLFYTALRLSELAALDVEDVAMTARRGRLQVRSGKGDAFREVPLNSACRAALQEWLTERGTTGTTALWLSRTGGRMVAARSTRCCAASPARPG